MILGEETILWKRGGEIYRSAFEDLVSKILGPLRICRPADEIA